MKHVIHLLSVILLTGAAPSRAETPSREARIKAILPALERTSRSFARAFKSPGTAIAVVTPERTDYITFGVREAGRAGRINASTIFQLASVSKPLTSTFAAKLVSQGQLQWDDSIAKLLPNFRFASEAMTRRTTVRDMLSQISGVPGETGDFLETLGYGESKILRQMRYVQTSENFHRKWAYTNFGITTGGVAAASVTGKPFAKAIESELFRQVGMRTAFASYRKLERTRNRARLHTTFLGAAQPLFVRDAEPEAPGGGINASVRDLAALVRLHLNEGRVGGRQLISAEALRETYRPSEENPGYALCWNVVFGDDGQLENVNHSGAFLAGSRTEIGFWPQEKIGIVVLTNSFPNLLPEAISDAFHQLYTTGKVASDTLRRFQRLVPQAFSGLSEDRERLRKSVDLGGEVGGVPLSAFTGVYRNNYAGRVEVRLQADPVTGQPTLFFVSGPRFAPVKIQKISGTTRLVSTTVEGDPINYEFRKLQGGAYRELRLPALKEIGWETLRRVP